MKLMQEDKFIILDELLFLKFLKTLVNISYFYQKTCIERTTGFWLNRLLTTPILKKNYVQQPHCIGHGQEVLHVTFIVWV